MTEESTNLISKVLNEEVVQAAKALGQHDQFEGYYIICGEHETLGEVDQLTPVYVRVAQRTGLTAAEVRRRYPGSRPSPDARGVALFGREERMVGLDA